MAILGHRYRQAHNDRQPINGVIPFHLIPSPHDVLRQLWAQLPARCVTKLAFYMVTVR